MRGIRFLVVLVLVLFPVISGAQEWPDEIMPGMQAELATTVRIEMYMNYTDNFWTVPDEIGADWWYGTLKLNTYYACLTLTQHTSRTCGPRGCGRGPETNLMDYRREFWWDADVGSYVAKPAVYRIGGDEYVFVMLRQETHGDWDFVIGSFRLVGGKFQIHESYPLYEYLIHERANPAPLRGGHRR